MAPTLTSGSQSTKQRRGKKRDIFPRTHLVRSVPNFNEFSQKQDQLRKESVLLGTMLLKYNHGHEFLVFSFLALIIG